MFSEATKIIGSLFEFSFFGRSSEVDSLPKEIMDVIANEKLGRLQASILVNQCRILFNFLVAMHVIEHLGIVTSVGHEYLLGQTVPVHGSQAKELEEELFQSPEKALECIDKAYQFSATARLPELTKVNDLYKHWILYLLTNNAADLDYCHHTVLMRLILTLLDDHPARAYITIREVCFMKTLAAIGKANLNQIFDYILQKNPLLAREELDIMHTTPLNLSVNLRQPDLVETLIKYGSDVNKSYLYSNLDPDYDVIPSPLATAIDLLIFKKVKNEELPALEKIIKLLLESGADPDLLTSRGMPREKSQGNYADAPDEYKPLYSLVIHHKVANQHLEGEPDSKQVRKLI